MIYQRMYKLCDIICYRIIADVFKTCNLGTNLTHGISARIAIRRMQTNLNGAATAPLHQIADLPYYGKRKQVTKMKFLKYGHFWYM